MGIASVMGGQDVEHVCFCFFILGHARDLVPRGGGEGMYDDKFIFASLTLSEPTIYAVCVQGLL